MGYNDYEPARELESSGPIALVQQTITIAVRVLGVALLLVGLWAGISVLVEAWGLYKDPAGIDRFAVAIEQGSNIDQLLGKPASSQSLVDTGTPSVARPVAESLRLSYFAAWFIALLLLLIIGGLSMSAVTTGAQLALHDGYLKRLSTAALHEVKQLRKVA